MTYFLAVILLIIALIVLVGTLLFITSLHRARFPQLPSIGQGAPGDPLRLNWRLVDWIIEIHEKLPGYYQPIGVVYGVIACVVAFILLFFWHYVVAIFGVAISYVGASYALEGISHALERKDYLHTSFAAAGIVLGFSVFFLHIAALFGHRLLPAWSL